jgi:hypothetical protein
MPILGDAGELVKRVVELCGLRAGEQEEGLRLMGRAHWWGDVIRVCDVRSDMIGVCDVGSGEGGDATERVCCLLVLDSVTSTPQWIRQPEARGCVHDACLYVNVCSASDTTT